MARSTRPLAVAGLLLWLTASLVVLLAGPARAQAAGAVHATRLEGPVTPVLADHLADVLADAAAADAALVLVEVDTPGGSDAAMRQIVQAVLASPVPVAVHVTPPGSRAASAGSVIGLSAHVLAMAPGTTIGAATPIDLQGGEVLDKVVNDAAAYVEALAELRGRDAAFHVDTVVEGSAASAEDALAAGAIDLVAEDRSDLLAAVHGREVEVAGGGTATLDVAGAAVEEVSPTLIRRILQVLADPNLAFVFLSLGTLAIVYEVANGAAGIGGAVGGVLLVLAAVSLSILPFDLAGLLLVALAAALFVGEAFIPGVGAFAGGGALALLVAGLLLFPRASGIGVSIGLVVGVAAVTGALALLIGAIAVRTRAAPPAVGAAGTVVGAVGVVKDADGSTGQVLVEGARWRAVSPVPLVVGSRVRVVALEGLTVTVQPEPAPTGR